MTIRLTVCPVPGCDRRHGVVVSKHGPARPYDGPSVSPLRASRTRLDDSADLGNVARDRVESETPDNPVVSVPVTGHPAGKPNRPRGTAESPAHPGRREVPSPAVRGHSRASIPVEVRTRRRLSPVGGE